MYQIIIFLILMVLGYFFGRFFERKHYRSIIKREKRFLKRPTLTGKKINFKNIEVLKTELVIGSVVVSIDYFKKFIAGLINILGGNVTSYESLIDRARREALLRMKESSPRASAFINTRIETSSISGRSTKKNSISSIEIMAYATAVTFKVKE